jgi:DNA-binding beta-propeller fold protein YncE
MDISAALSSSATETQALVAQLRAQKKKHETEKADLLHRAEMQDEELRRHERERNSLSTNERSPSSSPAAAAPPPSKVGGAASPSYKENLVAPVPPGSKLRGPRGNAVACLRVMLAQVLPSRCITSVLPVDILQSIIDTLPAEYVADYGAIPPEATKSIGRQGTGPGQFERVAQLAFGGDGNVWVTDCGGDRVQEVQSASGKLLRTFGGPPYVPLRNQDIPWSAPQGLAVMRKGGGSFFVADTGNNRVCEHNISDGAFVRILPLGQLNQPHGLCLSPDEEWMAITDINNHRVLLVKLDGSVSLRVIGSRGDGNLEFQTPGAVAFTPDGEAIVIADFILSRVTVVSKDGVFLRRIECGGYAKGIAVDGDGNILVSVVATVKRVKVFSPDGKLLQDCLGKQTFGGFGSAGLAVDPASGLIAVSEAFSTSEAVRLIGGAAEF